MTDDQGNKTSGQGNQDRDSGSSSQKGSSIGRQESPGQQSGSSQSREAGQGNRGGVQKGGMSGGTGSTQKSGNPKRDQSGSSRPLDSDDDEDGGE